jgi:peroxiredoxin
MTFRLLLAMLFAFALLGSTAIAQSASGPDVGTRIEDFTLQDQFGKQQKLSDLLSEGPIALVVLRSAGWCTPSKEQLLELQSELKSIEASGLRVVGISFDRVQLLKDFSSLQGIGFPLLSDPQSNVIEQLGIVNTTRKKGTLRYRVAYPLTILINRNSTVAGVVKSNSKTTLHNAQQLIDTWTRVKPAGPKKKEMSYIKVFKNQFVDDGGNQIIFKGLAIGDPDKIAGDGQWSRKHFEAIRSWGANIIRIPVHPQRLRRRGFENYLKLLDQAVRWCGELEMYVIIDWHSIGNLRTEEFESDLYRTSLKETLTFWETISQRFEGNPTVAFYEIYNELSVYKSKRSECSWPQWKNIVESIVDVIYANDGNAIPLVGGFDWSYDLRDVKSNPIDRPGIAYVVHPYPGKCKSPREPHWEEHFGFLAGRYPIFVTETGYYLEGNQEHFIDEGTFRNAILKYLDGKKISWCAWVFDPDWSPSLIKSYQYEPTHSGTFFKGAMIGK